MLTKAWLVARRELQENLRTKAFWIGILVFPIILVLAVVVPALLDQSKSDRAYAVVDHSGWLHEAVQQALQQRAQGLDRDRTVPENWDAATDRGPAERFRLVVVDGEGQALLDELNRRVAAGELFAYFVLGEDPVQEAHGHRYVSSNLTDDGLRRWFSSLASAVVRERRLAAEHIDAEIVRWVQEPLAFEARRVGSSGEDEDVQAVDTIRQWAPVAFVYLLWISIFSISQMLLTNTIEEKSNRIIEVLLSSLSPVQLMAGKIMGIAAAGLIMIGSWIGFFFLAVKAIPSLLGLELGFDLGVIATDPIYLVSFVVYFLLGYLLFATLFVGIGSLCNSLKEAQNLQLPVTLMLMVPMFTMIPVAQDPNGTLARMLSYVPPFTPFIMMNRAAGPPTPFEYVTTTLLLLISIAITLWGTAKVFRIGILMTGKPPRLLEVAKWLRAPVGSVPVRKT